MTPKEKATELWNKYVEAKIVTEGKYSNYRGLTTEHAKVCALIVVDEIIQGYEFDSLEINHKRIIDSINFWDEVKKEIEKL
jgi:hypothetical protein